MGIDYFYSYQRNGLTGLSIKRDNGATWSSNKCKQISLCGTANDFCLERS